MINLKDITKLPELTDLNGTEKVILNVDGSAHQAAVSLVKPAEEWDIDAAFTWLYNKESDEWSIEHDVKHIADFQILKDKIVNGIELKHKIIYAVQNNDDNQDFYYGYNRFSAYYCPAYVVAAEDVSDPEYIYFEITSDGPSVELYLMPDNTLDVIR